MKKSQLKALIREVIEEMSGPNYISEKESDENIPWGQHKDDWLPGGAGDPAHDKNHVKNKPFVVVVTDSDTGKKREIGFDDHDAAMDFKLAAEEDGTYWGFHQNKV